MGRPILVSDKKFPKKIVLPCADWRKVLEIPLIKLRSESLPLEVEFVALMGDGESEF